MPLGNITDFVRWRYLFKSSHKLSITKVKIKKKIWNMAKSETLFWFFTFFHRGETGCMSCHVYGGQRKFAKADSLLPPCGLPGLNSSVHHQLSHLSGPESETFLSINITLNWRFHTKEICFMHRITKNTVYYYLLLYIWIVYEILMI